MQYVLFTDKFGGYNGYMDPGKVGPSGATYSTDVDCTDGTLRPRFADIEQSSPYDTTISGTSKTIVPWSLGALGFDLRLSVASWGERLYRSHKGSGAFPASLNCIQYTSTISSNPTWDCLGLSQPDNTLTLSATTGGAGNNLAAGTYQYCTTFYNAAGHESAPSEPVQVVLSATGKIDLSNISRRHGSITFTSGSSSATITGNPEKFASGMRITTQTSGILPANTYITSINYVSGAITISNNALTGSTSADSRDAQIDGINIYRSQVVDGEALEFNYIGRLVGFSTNSFTDNGYKSGEALSTQASSLAKGVADIAISPSGILTCVGQDGKISYFSVESPGLYDPTQAIEFPSSPLASIYALNRFIYPTKSGAFSLSIEDPTSVPVLSIIDNEEPCINSQYVYCLNVGDAVWWNTNKGIVSTDGNSITPITRHIFTKEENASLVNCFGALYTNGDIYIYGAHPSLGSVIYYFNRENGWSQYTLQNSTGTLGNIGTLGFYLGNGNILYTGNIASSTKYVYRLSASSTRYASSVYRTGAWSGEHSTNLKKFRKISIVHSGSGSSSIQALVDGDYVGSAQTFTSTSRTQRTSFWLPSGTKGREVQLAISLSSGASIQELGVWVGEQREAMP